MRALKVEMQLQELERRTGIETQKNHKSGLALEALRKWAEEGQISTEEENARAGKREEKSRDEKTYGNDGQPIEEKWRLGDINERETASPRKGLSRSSRTAGSRARAGAFTVAEGRRGQSIQT